jgi:Carboxypeptidase regulatory-like domain/TonB dependent receptor-like, beta-barrel/TonB-dependent Receptor Plug Domain
MRALWTAIVLLFLTSTAYAQLTTGTLRGTVKSADDGATMAEAEVTLTHVPTGEVKTATTNADGAFAFTGLRVGGPYVVTAEFAGFKKVEERNIVLSADKISEITLALHLQAEVIEVKGTAVSRETSGRQTVSAAEIEQLPSIDRDPRDMVRRTPEATVQGTAHVMSIGGMNPRFNSITIDGLRMDDDFGLNQSGYPTRRSPIPLSAIEELVVEQAPFDVRYDKFLGGIVNIVTKSGTNDIHGEVLGTYTSDALIGHHTGSNSLTHTDFHEYRYGAEVAGPIIPDKVHFVFAAEGLSASTPTSVGPAGSNAANITSSVTQDEVAMAQQIAQSVYGFHAGDPSRSLDEGNINVFAKVDVALDSRNRITASYLRNSGNQIQQAGATALILPLTSQWFDAQDTLNAGTVRWFSDVTDRLSTEVSVSGKSVRSRVPPLEGNGFMAATILTPEGGQIKLGPDDFRHTNLLDNDLLQARASANLLAGNHLVTSGLEYELLHVNNLFIPDTNGQTTYASLADFMNQKPSQLFVESATTSTLDGAAAKFSTHTLALFLQDQWKLNTQLTITGGVRAEIYKSANHIVENSTFDTRYSDLGLTNTNTLDGKSLIMPRLGISYLVNDRLNLRAGGGLYSGGTPTVWMSNNYTNDGVRITQAFDSTAGDITGFDGRNIPDSVKALL